MSGELGEVEIKLTDLVKGVFTSYPTEVDENGEQILQKSDIRDFIHKIMSIAGEEDAWDEEEFDMCYREFDYDGNGTISEDELLQFVKRFAAL